MQGAIALHVHGQKTAGHQLPEYGAPFVTVQLPADVVGAQRMMAQLPDAGIVLAQQHVHHMVHAETLAGAIHAGQRLAGRFGAVPYLGRAEAGITIAAGLFEPVTEILQQGLAAAGSDLAQPQQGVQLVPLHPLVAFIRLGAVDHLTQGDHVLQAVHHPGVRGFAVAPGAARLLVIGLHALGQIQMGDEAHVRLVDAHAEGDGGADDDPVLAQKTRLVPPANLGGQAGMVGQGREPLFPEEGRRALHLLARQAVDDARIAQMFFL